MHIFIECSAYKDPFLLISLKYFKQFICCKSSKSRDKVKQEIDILQHFLPPKYTLLTPMFFSGIYPALVKAAANVQHPSVTRQHVKNAACWKGSEHFP